MNERLKAALLLAERGLYVFRLKPQGKLPAFEGWQQAATRDEEKIKLWFGDDPFLGIPQDYNVGVFTGRFKDDLHLVVIDVDNKNGKKGDDELLRLELEGKELPDTFTQFSPTGGRHLVYWTRHRVGNTVGSIARGLDTRGCGGLIVGAGSAVGDKYYTATWDVPIAEAPQWLIDSCFEAKAKGTPKASIQGVNEQYAESRAADYLKSAPVSVEGEGGNHTAYVVAAYLKDLGVSEAQASNLLLEKWNERCTPPWSPEEIEKIVSNAYAYGKDGIGVAAPEAEFQDDLPAAPKQFTNPVLDLNKEHAFLLAGGSHDILWETVDELGNFRLEFIAEQSFHRKFASKTWTTGDNKVEPITKLWMRNPHRRSYDGLCFRPGQEISPRYYNLWRGFTVKPSREGGKEAQDAVTEFFTHIEQNICVGEKDLFEYVMSWCAHLVQVPQEKPEVALVLRGKKGVGKGVLVDTIGELLGDHYTLVSNKRYLVGNFNSHLASTLMLVLDEAFWSGDKLAEGVLKDLITGKKTMIERKGQEPYKIPSLLRLAILGNEDWIIPASEEERRYAVLDVGENRKQDRGYFRRMANGMKAGGYALLLQHLLDYKIKIDVGVAPDTKGLHAQKIQTLSPFRKWWLGCLHEGELLHTEFGGWPEHIERMSLRDGFRRWCEAHRIGKWLPDETQFGKDLKECAGVTTRRTSGSERKRVYCIPPLEEARAAWDKFIGHAVEWEE